MLGQPLAGRQPARAVRRASPRRSARSAASRVTVDDAAGDPGGLPAADRREGHRLAAAGRPRPGRPRLAAQPRQRGHPARRGGRPDRRARVAAASSRRRSAQLLDGLSEVTGVAFDPRRPGRAARPRSARVARLRRRHAAGHRQPDHAQRRLQAQRHPAERRGLVDCRFLPGHEDDAARHHPRAGRASASRSRSCTATSRSRRRSTATWSTRWSRRCRPRTPAPRSCRTACPAAPTTRRSPARHPRLRLRAAAAAGRPRLRRHVPRRRRAGAGGRTAVRDAGAAAASCATC